MVEENKKNWADIGSQAISSHSEMEEASVTLDEDVDENVEVITASSIEKQSVETPISPALVDELRSELSAMQAQALAATEDYKRVLASMDNLRRRTEKEMANAHKFALERFVTALLPVHDGLEKGLESSGGTATEESLQAIRTGMDITLSLFRDVLSKFGVVVVDPQPGQVFDPKIHEALTIQPSAEQPANTVLVVVQRGFILNERVVRPAMVIVSGGS